jgi:hypothetical protein
MGAFILGAGLALFVGMRLARHIDGARGARADYKVAKTAVPGARKKAFGKTAGFVRFIGLALLLLIAVIYGLANRND